MLQDLLLFAVGIIVGVMNAVAGGGMLLGFPILLATGMPAIVANVTSNIAVLPGQISSAYGYRKYLARIPKQYLLLVIPCTVGAIIGTEILKNTSAESYQKLVPALIIFALILFIYQPFLHNLVHRHVHGSAKHRKSLKPTIVLCLAMLPVAVYGGFFGIGMGFIMLAFLGFTKVHEIHRMNALKNLMVVCTVSVSIICLLGSHLIDWHHGIVMGAGCLIGGYLGAVGAQKFSSHTLRVVVIVIGVCNAAYLVFGSY